MGTIKLKGKDLKCPTCGSKAILFRKTDSVHWCRKCGTEFVWEMTTDNKPTLKPKPKEKAKPKAKSRKKQTTKPKTKKSTKKQ